MLRLLTAAILCICLLAGTICAGTDYTAGDCQNPTECSFTIACDLDDHPCHDNDGTSHNSNCCDAHSHLSAITGHGPDVAHPIREKQFTAIIPHLTPQDFARIPFIPPRTRC